MAKRCFIARTGQVEGEFGAAAMTTVTPLRKGSVLEADSELHVLNTTFLEEPNQLLCKVKGSIKLGAITNGELTSSEEPGPG
jgi:hypothetical protein